MISLAAKCRVIPSQQRRRPIWMPLSNGSLTRPRDDLSREYFLFSSMGCSHSRVYAPIIDYFRFLFLWLSYTTRFTLTPPFLRYECYASFLYSLLLVPSLFLVVTLFYRNRLGVFCFFSPCKSSWA